MGITLEPPRAATAPLTFYLSAPQPAPVVIPRATAVSTRRVDQAEPAVFTTQEELRIQPAELGQILVRKQRGSSMAYEDVPLRRLKKEFTPFSDESPRVGEAIYLGFAAPLHHHVLGVDLMDLSGGDAKPGTGLLYRLIADPVLLVDVLYVVCKDQTETAGVTDEQFGRAMAGDAIDGATKAFLDELADFTPSPRDRARARKVIDATWKLIDRAQDLLDAKAEKELPAAIEAAMSVLGSSSTSSPASSEPTQDP